ncbi:MAG TPA: aminopeptidase [Xanthomonadales bacterium]|nr:aminopeptidase [Xanthomonadales bacterium]
MTRLIAHLAPALALLFASPIRAADGISPSVSPTSQARAIALRERAVADNAAWSLVESLTTEVGARLAGTEADARAVAWARARFEALGYDRVWLEPVKFPIWRRGHERAEVLPPFAQPLAITTLGGSVGTDRKGLEAEVVAFADLAALEAVPDASLDGRIAYIGYRMTRFRDGRGYGPAVAARSRGASVASAKGASALLIRSIGTDSHRFPHTGMMSYADGVRPIPAAALANPDADQIERLLARGVPVRLRLDLDVGLDGEYTSHNVIGEITGRSQPDEVVVIGGHLDSWDLGTGAIDDGAGVAITMAAGALIGHLPAAERPARSVRVIAWANEEQGLIGARAYAAAHADTLSKHIIGAESDFGAGRIYALRAGVDEASWPLIEQIGHVLAPLGIETQRSGGGPGPDIVPLAERGVAWAQLAQDGTDYFDYHHTADDTLDKIEPAALDQQVAAYAAFAYLMADAEGRPQARPRPAPTR